MHKLLNRGAEAVLYVHRDTVVKERIKKGYRISQIDIALRKKRTRKEEKLMKKAGRIGVPVPQIIETSEFAITMEFIKEKSLKHLLDKTKISKEEINLIFRKIADSINKLHKADIIHGDLTTSNMIRKDSRVYFIDFGLGFVSRRIEDKAVDLFLLKKALESKHPEIAENAISEVLRQYENKEVIARLRKLEHRGRYRKK